MTDLETIVKELHQLYENDAYMSSKLQQYIYELPTLLKQLKTTYDEKVSRTNEISIEQQQFVSNFLNNNYYFYNNLTEKFFHYDKVHYTSVSEDDVLYHILSSITQENSCLVSWKQKTKVHIVKKIKDKSLVKYAPESTTIQFILNLLNPFFYSKTAVKYFLTILGDSILKKNTQPLYHFMDSKCKSFLRELNGLCYFYIGGNMIQTIKHKYHDHNYSMCRFVKINDNIQNDALWKPVLEKSIDLFCVACHYSNRYQSSDHYLMNFSNDMDLISSVMYLKDKTKEDVVQLFFAEYIQIVDTDNNPTMSISWKNMLYLWKSFLENKGLPTIMFQDHLKEILMSRASVHCINDEFLGWTSKYLPMIQLFIDFWERHIDEHSSIDTELEIEEICVLFKRYNRMREPIPDKQIIGILTYFFPHIEIFSDKYIYGISCDLWKKDLEIEYIFERNPELREKDIDEQYLAYCQYYSKKEEPLLVSKSYFESKYK